MKRSLALVLVFSFLLSVSLVQSLEMGKVSVDDEKSYVYSKNTEISIKHPCFYSGTYCNSSTECNISIYDPKSNLIVDNKEMTFNNAYYNYTLPGNQSIGSYRCDMTCSDATVTSGAQTFYIEVETGGSLSLFLILAFSSVIIFGFAIWMENEYLGFIGTSIFVMSGLFSIIYGIGELSNVYTNSIGWTLLGLGLFFLISSAYSAIANGGFLKPGEFTDSLENDLYSDVWGRP